MKETIQIKNQIQGYGCFPTCIFMIEKAFGKNIEHSLDYEVDIQSKIKFLSTKFEEVATIELLVKKGFKVESVVENFELEKELNILKNVKAKFKIIGEKDIERLIKKNQIVICLIDDYLIHKDFHGGHVILIENFTKEHFIIVDPKSKTKLKINKGLLVRSLDKMKKKLNIIPGIYGVYK